MTTHKTTHITKTHTLTLSGSPEALDCIEHVLRLHLPRLRYEAQRTIVESVVQGSHDQLTFEFEHSALVALRCGSGLDD